MVVRFIFVTRERKVKYYLICPVCNQSIFAEADTDEEAVDKLAIEGKDHEAKFHSDMSPVKDEDMKAMIRTGMKKLMAE